MNFCLACVNFPSFLKFCVISLLICQFYGVRAWDSEDFELFDLVEEINQNFYDVLGISQDATVSEVRKAYRRLSLLHHPDKSKEEGAEERFRKIVAVSEVLKDESKRRRYDLVLKNGLPDWRQPVFYYRRVRKMGLWELMGFLLILLTVGQYVVAWASYWEKKYELEEILSCKFRRRSKKKMRTQDGGEDEIADHIRQLPRPCLQDLFPIQLVHLTIYLVTSLPTSYHLFKEWLHTRKPVPEDIDSDADPQPVVERKPRKRVRPDLPDMTGRLSEPPSESSDEEVPLCNDLHRASEWTQQETMALVKAINRFPGGTPDRWTRISESLGRPISEVTERAKAVKSLASFNVPATLQGVTGGLELPIWSQVQQKALENALQEFPKGTSDRWDHISEAVPDKTKEECIQRYKELVELVKIKKGTT